MTIRHSVSTLILLSHRKIDRIPPRTFAQAASLNSTMICPIFSASSVVAVVTNTTTSEPFASTSPPAVSKLRAFSRHQTSTLPFLSISYNYFALILVQRPVKKLGRICTFRQKTPITRSAICPPLVSRLRRSLTLSYIYLSAGKPTGLSTSRTTKLSPAPELTPLFSLLMIQPY